ncbi:MAG TPA: RNA polymerase sigma factor [Caulobacteraceae bacterium]
MTAAPEVEDRELVARSLAGDQRAFSLLLARYKEPVYRLIRRYVGSSDDAYDLLQQTFVSAWTSLGRYDRARPFAAWVRTIALNKCRDWSRRSAVRRLFVTPPRKDEVLEAAPDPQRGAEAGMVANEDEDELARELARLPAGLKEPLLLTVLEGLSQAEAGEVLGLSAKAVESRVYRARKVLADRLGRRPRSPS